MSRPQEILDYWFGTPDSDTYGNYRPEWFGPAPEFDEGVRERFHEDFEQAASGGLTEWEETPEGSLALILLLDQCSSILHRNSTRAFESDERGVAVARKAVEKGFDKQFPDFHRWFFYLPFEHSENPADQELSVKLFSELEPTEANKMGLDFAVRHKRVIDRFGRFPNRNEALGRESTPEELEFLAGPDAPY